MMFSGMCAADAARRKERHMENAYSPSGRDRLTRGEMLGNAGLGCFLAASGVFQFIEIINASRDGRWLVALYQVLICLSSVVMAGLVVVRRPAVAKGRDWRSHVVAVVGSFAILPLGALPLAWSPDWLLALTSIAMILTYVWILWALTTLRRSFSVFAEARKLVTHGPYGIVRHPLYAAYFLTYSCSALPKLSLLAVVLVAVGVSAEVMRSRNEERILSATFPEYAEYARRVPAFFPASLRPKGRAEPRTTAPAPGSF
jgi:protein-S-isoprenylcysteine O-methyltransferase Ste14